MSRHSRGWSGSDCWPELTMGSSRRSIRACFCSVARPVTRASHRACTNSAPLQRRSLTTDRAGRIRIMKGLSWRYGYVNVNRVTTEQLRELDSGTLLVTNKRLLFNGSRKNVSVPLKRVIHFTLFKDAIQIEKDCGKDL